MKKYKLSVLIERDEDSYLVANVPSLKSSYTHFFDILMGET